MPGFHNAPPCAPPDPQPRPPRRAVPALSCDTHMHICGPEDRYPYSAARIYTPPDAVLPDYLNVATTLGIERVVFVQPSIYGADNSAMLAAMRACPLPCRGVVVIDQSIDDETLRAWHALGVRGIRLNAVDTKTVKTAIDRAEIDALVERIAPLGWHLELLVRVDEVPDLDAQLAGLPVDVVFGHLGYARHGARPDDPGFVALLRLLERGHCWVKLTGPYRLTSAEPPYPAVGGFASALMRAAPERLVWGSDWPHVMVSGTMPNDGALLDLLFAWASESCARERILVDNPAALYDFRAESHQQE